MGTLTLFARNRGGHRARLVRPFGFGVAICLVLATALIGWARGQSKEIAIRGLTAQDGGRVVYDANNKVFWLADANFAASIDGQKISREMGVSGIHPNGTMDYPTARQWVKALNDYNGGWLGHNNWRLPVSPVKDSSCGSMGPQGASFGVLCQGNPLGNLYYVGLRRMFPDNVSPAFGATVAPFENVQISYYWTAADGGLHGKKVFSFASGSADATTIVDSYYFVLPMVPKLYGPIGGEAPDCSADLGSHVVLYTHGPAKDKAVYDCTTGNSWLRDANLAASDPFRIVGDVEIEERRPYPRPGRPTRIKALLINGGAMLWETADRWVRALRDTQYLQNKYWQLPDSPDDLRKLVQSLNFSPGDARLMAQGKTGPFQNLQPFFYWEECMPNLNGTGGTSPACEEGNAPPGAAGGQMNYDFTFGYGLQGTDLNALKYFVMVYYTERR